MRTYTYIYLNTIAHACACGPPCEHLQTDWSTCIFWFLACKDSHAPRIYLAGALLLFAPLPTSFLSPVVRLKALPSWTPKCTPLFGFLEPKKINCMSAKILGGRDGKTSPRHLVRGPYGSDTGRVLTASRKRRGCSDAGAKKSAHTVDAHKAGLAFSRCVWRPRSRNRARAGDAGRGIPPSTNHPPASRASQAAQATARIVHAVQNRKRKWYWPGIHVRVCRAAIVSKVCHSSPSSISSRWLPNVHSLISVSGDISRRASRICLRPLAECFCPLSSARECLFACEPTYMRAYTHTPPPPHHRATFRHQCLQHRRTWAQHRSSTQWAPPSPRHAVRTYPASCYSRNTCNWHILHPFAVCNTALARFTFLKRPVVSTTNLESCFVSFGPCLLRRCLLSLAQLRALSFYCARMLSLPSACECSLVRCVSFSCLPLAALLSAALFVTVVWAHTHKHTHTQTNTNTHTYANMLVSDFFGDQIFCGDVFLAVLEKKRTILWCLHALVFPCCIY